MTISDEQIRELLRIGNPTDEERRLIRMGWDAALARMRTTAVPDRWKLVPIEPTPTMVKAGLESSHVLNVHRVLACYDAMLDAAPEAKL